MNGFAILVGAIALLQAEPGTPPGAAPVAAPSAQDAPSPRPSLPGAARGRGGDSEATSPATPSTAATPTGTGTAAGPATPPPAPRVRVDPAVERAEAERVARAFVDALAASDAGALAAAAADRFSFDGDTVAGRDAIRSRWRSLLAERSGRQPRVGAVELLPSADAIARLGKPPARVAPLARPGAWVALADVGGRPVVLFVAREASRMAVLGMHD